MGDLRVSITGATACFNTVCNGNDIQTAKKPVIFIPKGFLLEQLKDENQKGNLLTQVHLANVH